MLIGMKGPLPWNIEQVISNPSPDMGRDCKDYCRNPRWRP
jgi:hypothetical protein